MCSKTLLYFYSCRNFSESHNVIFSIFKTTIIMIGQVCHEIQISMTKLLLTLITKLQFYKYK